MNINIILLLIIILAIIFPRFIIVDSVDKWTNVRPVMQRGMYFNNPRWSR